jgi:integrase
MASAKRTAADYIFQRPGSANFWIKLRSDGKRLEKSLGTPDKAQAVILALPMIAEHKARLLAKRPRIETVWQHKLEPGREHAGSEGGKIVATDRELIHIGPNRTVTLIEPNGGFGTRIAGLERRLGVPSSGNMIGLAEGSRPVVPTKNSDDAIFQTYLDHGGKKKTGLHGHFRREAESVWALFKTLTGSKPLKDCTRDDGRKLVAHFQVEGLRSATIQKKVTWLNAAINLAIKEGRYKSINPFSGVAPDGDDKMRRLPLDDGDIKACKRSLNKLDDKDQLLLRLLATTGMRLSEAFEISGEKTERDIRYVIVGNKTEQSLRRVPLPAHVLPYLPKSIKGPLFEGSTPAASKRLNKYLRETGIADTCKVLHSLRHRAQDRLRAAGCPQDVRWAILGHEETTVAAGYGEGFPVTLLRKWIDKIGF